MGTNGLQLSDLISLEGLEKPADEVSKFVIGGADVKPEKVNQLREKMSGFAGEIENNDDVQIGGIAGLVESLKKAMMPELSPEKTAALLPILKRRFEAKDKRYKSVVGITWTDLQKKLEASPYKLWPLNEMERTGGEPDVIAYDKKTGEYIFYDCSAESPLKRRHCVYDEAGEVELKKINRAEGRSAIYYGNAISMAALMGINLLTESEYRAFQTKGLFDRDSWIWLKTPLDERKKGKARRGFRGVRPVGNSLVAGVGVNVGTASYNNGRGGFRGSLRV